MTYRRISKATWQIVREDWVSSPDPAAAIAARHGIGISTLSHRARAEGWPPRGSGANDPALIARRLYADITVELRASLDALHRAGADEPAATANQRATLVRAHRRALIAVLDARKPLPKGAKASPAAPPDTSFPALDLVTARADILARLSRFDAVPPVPPP